MAEDKHRDDQLQRFVEDAEALQIDTDVADQQRANRERLLQQWDLQHARQTAAQLGITLSDAHLAVVKVLQDHYLAHGEAEDGRILEDLLDAHFAAQGGRKYLHQLFPEGPVSQGMRIAELPLPPHSVDGGFGTAR